jgi:PAS domain S-box-containing protein
MKERRPSPRKRSSPVHKKTPRPVKPAHPTRALPPDNFSLYFDSPIDLLCIGDLNGNLLKLNPEWEKTFGYPISELRGKYFLDFIHPEDRQATLTTFGEAIQKKEVKNFTNRFRCKDGGYRWLEWSAVLRGKHVYTVARDITDRKQAENALRESEERFQRITRTITDYIYHVRVENGKAVETLHGQRCLEVTGYSAEEFSADPNLWMRMVDPQDRPLVEDQENRILIHRESPVIQHRLWRKDGVRRWVQNTPVLHCDANGKLLSFDGLIQDITDRIVVELQIRAQHDLALALNATSNMEEGLRLCLNTALLVSGMESGGIYLRDESSGMFDLVVHQGLAPGLLAVVSHLDPDRAEAHWIMEGKPVYRDYLDLTTHPGDVAPPYQEFHSLIGIPIRYEDRIIGCISLVSFTLDKILPFIRETVETMVAQIGNAIARLRIETALRESEDRYRQLFESESDAIFLAEKETGRILEANEAASALYGYSRAELATMVNTDLSAEREETQRTTRDALANPKDIVVIPHQLHRKKDGTVFPVEITARFFPWRGTGVFIAAIRDISQRRKIEEELRDSRQMLETVLNTIPVRVFWKDRESKFLGCNKPFALDSGLSSPAELIGLDDYHMGWAEQAGLYRADDRLVIETGQPKLNYEEPQTTPSGSRIWLRTSKIPLRDPEGNIHGILGTYEDITEYKKAEEEIRALNVELEQRVALRTAQLEATNKELEAFSYSISHDLRAPLRAIDGFTRVLEEDYGKILDEEGNRLCGVIRRSTRHMNDLIDSLLTLSRLSSTEMEYLSVDMESTVRSVFQELTTPESRARIEFSLGSLPAVTGDPIMLRQVWTNLIANAIKFSSRLDRARIRVECQRTSTEDIFSVRDNGAGFDMQYSDRLFGIFQRLHTTSEFEGTGVGLAIIQRAIHRHGGRVWAEGEVDKGSVFYFALPNSKPENGNPSAGR